MEEAISSIELRRDERLYAMAFRLFYGETGAVIRQPMVGLSVETALGEARFQTAYDDACAEGCDAGSASLRWNPADREHDIRADAIEAAYTSLATEACGMDQEEARHAEDDPARNARWEMYFDRSIDAVTAVIRELTRRARARIGVFAALPLTDDFVAVVCDPSQGEDGEDGSVAASTNGFSRRSSRTSHGVSAVAHVVERRIERQRLVEIGECMAGVVPGFAGSAAGLRMA